MKNIKVKYYNANDDWDGWDKGTKRNSFGENEGKERKKLSLRIYTKWTVKNLVEIGAVASGDIESL